MFGHLDIFSQQSHLSRPIRITLAKSSSPSVGARVVERGRVGLHGRPSSLSAALEHHPAGALPAKRATMKAHSTHPLPARPYGSPSLLPLFMA